MAKQDIRIPRPPVPGPSIKPKDEKAKVKAIEKVEKKATNK